MCAGHLVEERPVVDLQAEEGLQGGHHPGEIPGEAQEAQADPGAALSQPGLVQPVQHEDVQEGGRRGRLPRLRPLGQAGRGAEQGRHVWAQAQDWPEEEPRARLGTGQGQRQKDQLCCDQAELPGPAGQLNKDSRMVLNLAVDFW